MNAICQFCNRHVVYGGVEFGESFLHDGCFVILQQEMDETSVVVELTPLPLLENRENGERVEEVA